LLHYLEKCDRIQKLLNKSATHAVSATLDNSFLFILQGSALADLRYGGRFYGTRCPS